MRDRLVFGCEDENLREKFFKAKYDTLTFAKAVEICTVYQSARRQMSACKVDEQSVHAVKRDHKSAGNRSHSSHEGASSGVSGAASGGASGGAKYSGAHGGARPKTYKSCDYCGRKHPWGRDKCPAYGKKCGKCGRDNHFAAQCKSGKGRPGNKVHAVTESSDSETEYVMSVGNKKLIMAEMEIVESGKRVKFQVDSGASVNAIPRSLIPM